MRSCTVLGHRVRFWAEGADMRWACERGCGLEGRKRYSSGTDARRYARALDREDRDDLGKRAPLIGLFPLRIARAITSRRQRRAATPPSSTAG